MVFFLVDEAQVRQVEMKNGAISEEFSFFLCCCDMLCNNTYLFSKRYAHLDIERSAAAFIL